jgi:adenosylhomocysteine nucleosidase
VVVIISADIEWRAVRTLFPAGAPGIICEGVTPLGEWFELAGAPGPLVCFHGGWGKIAAAASAQYVIEHWRPVLLVNLGTCGGFEGLIERGTIILATQTIVYDIIEQMGDFDAHIAHYTTDLDLSWLPQPDPPGVRRTRLVSGDRDLVSSEIAHLQARYAAVAGDWESGAIAWVARHNGARCLIARGVTDLVGSQGGEAYGNLVLFEENTRTVMERLFGLLPDWLAAGLGG